MCTELDGSFAVMVMVRTSYSLAFPTQACSAAAVGAAAGHGVCLCRVFARLQSGLGLGLSVRNVRVFDLVAAGAAHGGALRSRA